MNIKHTAWLAAPLLAAGIAVAGCGEGELDAIATMEELIEDDLRALAIELAHRVVAAGGGSS